MRPGFAATVVVLSLVACGGTVSNGGRPTDAGVTDSASSSSGSSGGSGSGSGGSSGGGSSGSSSGGSTEMDSGTTLSGTYMGYIQSYKFLDGSDTVVVTLTFAGDTVTGTVYFGNGSPLPPATDPNVGYPPGFMGSNEVPLEGFEFTALAEPVNESETPGGGVY
jgi:hypothetical protein